MTASEIAKALGVTEGTKTFEFPEPVKAIQAKGGMPGVHYTLTHADIIERAGRVQIIVKGTLHFLGINWPVYVKWNQVLASARHLLENALLKSNA